VGHEAGRENAGKNGVVHIPGWRSGREKPTGRIQDLGSRAARAAAVHSIE
jgi:hypothetical protein